VCTTGGLFLKMTAEDQSDPDSGIVCIPFEDVTTSARFGYYAARLLKLFLV